MFLKQLKLTNFRNYLAFDQSFDHLKTIIIGQNAQGKSNILEAINILAKSTSDRAQRDNDLIYWNKDFSIINALITKNEETLEISLQINPHGKRKLKINGVAKRAPMSDLMGNFFTVMFSSDDLYLLKGSPSQRRSWIDTNLIQLYPRYHKLFQDYQKSVTQKNALLKSAFESKLSNKELKEQLEIWNEQIINSGAELLIVRTEYIQDIVPVAKDFLSSISKQEEDLELIYQSSIINKSNETSPLPHDGKKIRDIFRIAINKSFDEELSRGQTVVGPHRDDLLFLVNKKEAKSFASQGQQRSIILALKLSELKVIEMRKNEVPVLLLDDVFAELDVSRQDFLLHHLPKNIQTFITTTHISDLQKELLENAQVLKVENGKVKSEVLV